jgi:HlyD family type I secretion membrane fusion protein
MKRRSKSPQIKGALNRAKEVELARQPRLAGRISFSLCAMVVGMIILAAKTNVPNVTRAPGEILPYGNYSQVETLDGGIVAAIHVVEGQLVAAGEPLIDLRQPDLLRRRDALLTQQTNEQLRLDNLNALRSSLINPTSSAQKTVDVLRSAGFVDAADQLQLFAKIQQAKSLAIDRHLETTKILSATLAFSENRIETKLKRMEASQSLRNQGLMTERQYQVEDDQLNALRSTTNAARVDLAEARSELMRMTTDRENAGLDLQKTTLADVREKRNILMDLAAELTDTNAQLADLYIVAPVAGAVQSVAFPNLGEVITPGETLFEIVPLQLGLVVEARIPGADIGHVAMMQSVSIGVDTFDPRRFGKLTGQLLSLSPVPLTDEITGEYYFRAAIALDHAQIGQGNMKRALRSGMTVVAEIVTGEQTVLAYFLKPIDATLNGSFRER